MLSSGLFRGDNLPLIQIFSNWGPSVLRIGGNSVNKTTWSQDGIGKTKGVTSPSDVKALADFLRATGWKAIYGLNATTSTPALTTSEASAVAQILGDRLQDFEIGNEPDLYHSNGLKDPSYNFSGFMSDWDAYTTGILQAVPGAVFSGPATAYNYAAFTIPFAQARGAKTEFLTQHYYRANGQLPTSTIDMLLTPDPKLIPELNAIKSAAQAQNIPLRMAEANSFYNGGAPGVSNGFGTALWIIEYCFTLAQAGVAGVNFHGGGNSSGYTPIANDASGNFLGARAEYYGMLLFATMGTGKILTAKVSGDAGPLFTASILGEDGTVSTVLMNKSRTEIIRVALTLPMRLLQSQALILSGPSLDATSGFSLGGSAVASDGSWNPATTYDLDLTMGTASVDVPAGTAILLQGSSQ